MKAAAFLASVLWNVPKWAECNCLETVEVNVPAPGDRRLRRERNQAVVGSAHTDYFACVKASGGPAGVVNHGSLSGQNWRMQG
jgi:hypothetical protein